MKKLLFLLLSTFSLTALQTQKSTIKQDESFPNVYYNASKFPEGLPCSGNLTLCFRQVLVAWDLNGVIFKKEYSIPANLYQLAVTDGYGWVYTFKIVASFGKLWRYKTQLQKQGDPRGHVWDAMFETLETSDEGKKVAELLRRFSQQANVVNCETIAILQELAEHGHHNVVLSNMGTGLVHLQVNLLKRTLENDTMTAQQIHSTQFVLQFLTNPEHNVIASPENNWLHKPMRESYATCLQKNQLPHNQRTLTIFIDDKKRNIAPALANGLFDIAVLFTTAKDLRTFLDTLGNGKLITN
jgi:hypothetical protein